MTPEQVAAAVERARTIIRAPYNSGLGCDPFEMETALLAEHERANANAQDAARWRAVRDKLELVAQYNEGWFLDLPYQPYPAPATVDEAADRLIAEQEARDGSA